MKFLVILFLSIGHCFSQGHWFLKKENHFKEENGKKNYKTEKLRVDELLRLTEIISKNGYQELLNKALGKLSLKKEEDLVDYVFACKFKSNDFSRKYMKELQAEKEQMVLDLMGIHGLPREEVESLIVVKNVSFVNGKLNRGSVFKGVASLSYEDYKKNKVNKKFLLEKYSSFKESDVHSYDFKVKDGFIDYYLIKGKPSVCLRYDLDTIQAAQVLVHELIHLIEGDDHFELIRDELNSEQQFVDFLISGRGGEVSAFEKEIQFHLDLVSNGFLKDVSQNFEDILDRNSSINESKLEELVKSGYHSHSVMTYKAELKSNYYKSKKIESDIDSESFKVRRKIGNLEQKAPYLKDQKDFSGMLHSWFKKIYVSKAEKEKLLDQYNYYQRLLIKIKEMKVKSEETSEVLKRKIKALRP